MLRGVIRTGLCAAAVIAVPVATADAAGACGTDQASISGLNDGDSIRTGHSTFALTISVDSFTGPLSNVTASAPPPAAARAVQQASTGRVTLTLDLPSAGSVPVTVSWDQHGSDPTTGATVPCSVSVTLTLKAIKVVSAAPSGRNTGFTDGLVADFNFLGCRSVFVAQPVTVTVRYRLGARRGPHPVPPTPPAPNARSPKVTLVVPKPCADRLPSKRVVIPGRGAIRIGPTDNAPFGVSANRYFRGRGAYSGHLIVEFAMPGFRTVRFDVRGYFALGAGGKASETKVRRL